MTLSIANFPPLAAKVAAKPGVTLSETVELRTEWLRSDIVAFQAALPTAAFDQVFQIRCRFLVDDADLTPPEDDPDWHPDSAWHYAVIERTTEELNQTVFTGFDGNDPATWFPMGSATFATRFFVPITKTSGLISLEGMKARVGGANDAMMTEFLAEAETFVESILGFELEEFGTVPESVKEAVRQMAAHFYAHPEERIVTVPPAVLDQLRCYRKRV